MCAPRARGLSRFALKLIATALLLSSCGSVEEELARRAWLQDAFAAEHLALIQRAPALVAGKLLKMRGEDGAIYPYFRGSAGIYHQDLARGGDPSYSSEFLSPAGAQLWILGDPHFENLGFFCPSEDGALRFGWNDFDGSTLGPWVFDLRRLALSGWLIGEALLERRGEAEARARLSPSALVEAIVRGYHGELARLVSVGGQGAAPIPALPWLQGELARASESRPTREAKLISRYLKLDPAQPALLSRARFRRGTLRASESAALFDRTLSAVSEGTARAVDAALQRWAASKGARVTLHDIVRRYGAGVSSYPLYRYYLLAEVLQPPSTEGEVILLELKELRDPVGWSGLARESAAAGLPAAAWTGNEGVLTNGARVVTAQRLFQGVEPPYDPWLSAIEIGPLSFRLRHLSGCQRGLDFEDLIDDFSARDDREGPAELKALMRFIGARLAEAHGRPLGRDGRAGWEVIAAELPHARLEALIIETLRFTEAYARRLHLDHAHLRAIIEDAGPLLGLEGRLSTLSAHPAGGAARPFLDDPPPPAANEPSDE